MSCLDDCRKKEIETDMSFDVKLTPKNLFVVSMPVTWRAMQRSSFVSKYMAHSLARPESLRRDRSKSRAKKSRAGITGPKI